MKSTETALQTLAMGLAVVFIILLMYNRIGPLGKNGERGSRGFTGPTGPIVDSEIVVTEHEATGPIGIQGVLGPTGARGIDAIPWDLVNVQVTEVPYGTSGSMTSVSGPQGTYVIQMQVPQNAPFLPVAKILSGPSTLGTLSASGANTVFQFQIAPSVSGLLGPSGLVGITGNAGTNSIGPTGASGQQGVPGSMPSSGPNALPSFKNILINKPLSGSLPIVSLDNGLTFNHFFFTIVGGGGSGSASGPGGGGGSGFRMSGYASVASGTQMNYSVGAGGIQGNDGSPTYIEFEPSPDCVYYAATSGARIKLSANGGLAGYANYGGDGYGGGGGASGVYANTYFNTNMTIGGYGGMMNGQGALDNGRGGYGGLYDPSVQPQLLDCGLGGNPNGSYVILNGQQYTSTMATLGGGGHGAYYNGATLVDPSDGGTGYIEMLFF